MQGNTITLVVDPANNGTTENQVYTRFDDSKAGISKYLGPDFTYEQKQTLQFYRTEPTVSGIFRGTRKSAAKFTQEEEVENLDGSTSVRPLIVEISFSLPVGATAALVKELRQRAVALLDDDAIMDPLNLNLSI